MFSALALTSVLLISTVKSMFEQQEALYSPITVDILFVNGKVGFILFFRFSHS
jgi:hypothetical protein